MEHHPTFFVPSIWNPPPWGESWDARNEYSLAGEQPLGGLLDPNNPMEKWWMVLGSCPNIWLPTSAPVKKWRKSEWFPYMVHTILSILWMVAPRLRGRFLFRSFMVRWLPNLRDRFVSSELEESREPDVAKDQPRQPGGFQCSFCYRAWFLIL